MAGDGQMLGEDEVVAMTATTTDRRRFDDGWAFERKVDGFRCLAFVDGDDVRLRSRNRTSFDGPFADIATALRARARGALIVDGEVIGTRDGATSFALLQQRLSATQAETGIALQYVVFDLLWFDGHDVRSLPLEARQGALADVIDFGGPLARSEAMPGDAEALLAAACAAGWEGLVAKRLGSTYQPRRSRDWLKLKCTARQEVVVGGFTEPQGSRSGLGALLVGVYDDTGLRFAGKVGTGFDDATLRSLRAELGELEVPGSPFVDPIREPRVHWVAPELVVEVGFGEWSDAGRLRHPRYLGRRPDKDPTAVVREPT